MAKRFEIAAPRDRSDADAWKVSLKQLGLLALVGAAIVCAIYLIENGIPGVARTDAQAIQLEGEAIGPAPKVGEPAPDFTLKTITGQDLQLSSLQGRPVLLNFWATWCPPCRAEIPDLDQVARERADTGLAVVAINLQEDLTTAATYLMTLDIRTFLVPLDTDGRVFRQYRINGMPTTVLIDRSGVVREIHVGALTKRAIDARIGKIL